MQNGQTSKVRVVLSWLFVSIPLIWGIAQTIAKSMALFN